VTLEQVQPRLERLALADVLSLLKTHSCVVLVGPPRCGKTDLANAIARTLGDGAAYIYATNEPSILQQQLATIADSAGRLVIVDEAQQVPTALTLIRSEMEVARRSGKAIGSFLLLGSNSRGVRTLVAKTLPAMYAQTPLDPVNRLELGELSLQTASVYPAVPVPVQVGIPRSNAIIGEEVHWNRGGLPESLLAHGDVASLSWRRDYISAICDGYSDLDAQSALRALEFVASRQGAELNIDQYPQKEARSFLRYLGDVGVIRWLASWSANRGKTLTRPPKAYIRDSGLLHCLLRTASAPNSSSADYGPSWEGYCVENLIAAAPPWTTSYFYRDDDQNEVDLALRMLNGEIWAIEIKGRSAKLRSGFARACDLLGATERLVVRHGSTDTLEQGFSSISLRAAMQRLQSIPRSI